MIILMEKWATVLCHMLVTANMRLIQEAVEEKQVLLKSKAHCFYTTNISYYEPYEV